MYSFDTDSLLPRPVIKIIYSASTWGELTPCPSCRTSYGGLARRYSYIKESKASGCPVLVISGPDEFIADMPDELSEKELSKDIASVSHKAFSALNVDLGWLSPKASNWFNQTIKKVPTGFHAVGTKPLVKKINTPQGFVGIIFLPYGKNADGTPSYQQLDEIIESANTIKKQVVLLVAVSPWGFKIERDLAPILAKNFHCLLGGGEGPPFAHSIPESSPSLLWCRPENNGMAITEINFYELPPSSVSGRSPNWMEGVTFKADIVYLGDRISSDPLIEELLLIK